MALGIASITILQFPRDDGEFESLLERIAAQVGPSDPAAFQDRVRETYPKAVVRTQDPLGSYRAGGSVWYVYRDGSAVPG